MTSDELIQLRREKWRLTGNPVRILDDARSFIESVGLCLTYPSRPAMTLPTFIGAWYGSDERLPVRRAFLDPQARDATDLMIRLLRESWLLLEVLEFGQFRIFGRAKLLLSRFVGDSRLAESPPLAITSADN